MPLLDVRDLVVHYAMTGGVRQAVDGVSFSLDAGEYLGIVGESGCGKTTLIRGLLRILPDNGRIEGGSVMFEGADLARVSESVMRALRWRAIALVPQSAMNALDPVIRVGDQIVEAIQTHESVSQREAWQRAGAAFRRVGLSPGRLRDYPHQFSGGMRQRAMIAMALVLDPAIIIGDEPTTGLDVVVQDQILGRLKELQRDLNKAMILVTHNIAVVAENCDQIAVMYAGKVFEYGTAETILKEPFNPYTLGLKNAFPSIKKGADERELIAIPGSPPSLIAPPPGCRFEDRCPFATDLCREQPPPLVEVAPGHMSLCHYPDRVVEMRALAARRETWQRRESTTPAKRSFAAASPAQAHGMSGGAAGERAEVLQAENLRTWFPASGGLLRSLLTRQKRWVHAVDGIDLTLHRGAVIGLAGESGCGKSTTGMTLARLVRPTSGRVRLGDLDVTGIVQGDARLKRFRREVQLIFQDPYGSLNPRFTVGQTVIEPLVIHKIGSAEERLRRMRHALEMSELSPAPDYETRYPHQLSGGQRQRVAIARAVVLEPKFLIADEPVSMLDVSVRAGILTLLRMLVNELGIGLIYVSHDLSTMNHICDEVAIMYLGKIVEQGPTERVLSHPLHPYAQALIAAVPVPDPTYRRERIDLPGEVPDAVNLPPGCRFAPRCPFVMPACHMAEPALTEIEPDHRAACHLYTLPEAELSLQAQAHKRDMRVHAVSAARREEAR
jgi:peptide/nickel transport system ATP-binding protein